MSKHRAAKRRGLNQLRLVLLLAVLTRFFQIPAEALAQRISFGAVTGTTLLDDFRSGSITNPCAGNGCVGTSLFQSNDASRRFIIGASAEVAASKILSFEIEALYRPIRHNSRIDYMPPVDLGNGVIVASQSFSGSDHALEFPTLAKFRIPTFRTHPVFEFGTTFHSTQDGTVFGMTVGAGVEVPVKSLSFAPRVRYTRWPARTGGFDPLLGFFTPRQDQIAIIVGFSQAASTSTRPNAFGKAVSIGGIVGMGLSNDFPSTVSDVNGIPGSRSFSDSKSPVIGLMIELEPIRKLFIEFNGLYRPLHLTDESSLSGSVQPIPPTRTGRVTVLTWEFPILAKYKLTIARTNPFFEVGPTFRTSGNLNDANPSKYGATGGAGVEAKWGKVRISPTLRYTRWTNDQTTASPTNRNQFEALIGISY
jgi:hypothetical protein